MKHLGLFEGIGGFSLASRWMGWETVAWCEWNPFCQTVLKHHFPEANPHSDITKTDFTKYANTIDILTGGFPCQPYSLAGKRKGKEDERHLWPEMLRAIREIKPRWVVGENVFGLINWSDGLVFHEVQTDLEAEGYEVFPYVLPACAVNAPHRRDRVWFVAYLREQRCDNGGDNRQERHIQATGERKLSESESERNGWEFGISEDGSASTWNATNPNGNGFNRSNGKHEVNPSEGGKYALGNIEQMGKSDIADTNSERYEKRKFATFTNRQERQYCKTDFTGQPTNWENFPTEPPVCGRNDGIPGRLDRISIHKKRGGVRILTGKQAEGYLRNESIKAYGNAIVPQVAVQIFKAIQQYEQQ